jgi:hypothetical protein
MRRSDEGIFLRSESDMNTARIFWISTSSQPGYAWKWQTGERQSTKSFAYYYDCVTDARQQGNEVELSRAVGETAPGGASYRLEGLAYQAGRRP